MTQCRILCAVFVVVAMVATVARPFAQSRDEIALRAAIETETMKGDLQTAIAEYQKLAESRERAVAAVALVRLAACHEKLGHPDARRIYTQVIEKFGDQSGAAAEANRRLAALTSGGAATFGTELLASKHDDRRYGFTVSKDRRFIPFIRGRQLFLQDLTTGEDRLLLADAPQAPELPMISPDGRTIVYTSLSPRRIMLLTVDSKATRELLVSPPGMSTAAFDWSPDGKQVLVISSTPPTAAGAAQLGPRPSQVRLVSISDGSPSATFHLPFAVDNARLSPDGRYAVLGLLGTYLSVLSLTDGTVNQIAEGNARKPFWTPDGSRVVFLRLRRTGAGEAWDLWAVPVTAGRASGPPQFLMRDVGDLQAATGDAGFLYRVANSTRDIYAVDIDPDSGQMTSPPRQLTNMDDSRAPAWSPDGEQLAFVTFGRLAGFEGSLLPTAIRITSNTTANRVLAPNPPFRTHPRSVLGWFPDGQSLLLRCIKNTLCRVDLKTGQFSALLPDVAVPVEQGDIYTTTTRLSHDGRYFYYLVSGADGGPRRIARLDLAGGSANDVASVPVRQLIDLALSADGQQLAFIALLGTPANPQGRALMTVPASGGEPRIVHQPSGGAIRGVTWSLDGRRLFYSSAGDHLQTNDPLSTAPGEWRRDIWTVGIDGSDPRPLGVGLQDEYFLNTHPNGRSLVFMEENYRNELWMLRLPATLGK